MSGRRRTAGGQWSAVGAGEQVYDDSGGGRVLLSNGAAGLCGFTFLTGFGSELTDKRQMVKTCCGALSPATALAVSLSHARLSDCSRLLQLADSGRGRHRVAGVFDTLLSDAQFCTPIGNHSPVLSFQRTEFASLVSIHRRFHDIQKHRCGRHGLALATRPQRNLGCVLLCTLLSRTQVRLKLLRF